MDGGSRLARDRIRIHQWTAARGSRARALSRAAKATANAVVRDGNGNNDHQGRGRTMNGGRAGGW